jgi:23S rRNA (adenine2030-N6)-methyltransferase
MNYRHAFHAGNFADLLKHSILLWLMRAMQAQAGGLTVLDTHAGRGFYDLTVGGARSAEAEAGIARLAASVRDMPGPLDELAGAVRRANDGRADVKSYPGSPWLIAEALRSADRLVACELREEEHAALQSRMAKTKGVETRHADGYEVAARMAGVRPLMVLIDPPFERPDDYQRCAEVARRLSGRADGAVTAIWTPIKDMETFDGFLRALGEDLASRALVAELRLRPLTNPMKLNGCAMVLLNAPDGASEVLAPVTEWLARELGEAGARGEVWSPGD